MRALSMLGSDAAAAFPKSMEVEFIERKGGENGDSFEKLLRYCDLLISKAVLGQTSTTDAVAGGLGSGQADSHSEVRKDIEQADAKLLAATLNRDLVVPIVMLNRGHRARYPKLRIGRPESEDVDTFLKVVDNAVKHGVPVSVSTFRRRTGLEEPKAGEELLGASQPGDNAQEPNKSPPAAAAAATPSIRSATTARSITPASSRPGPGI